jgi:5'-nucleotidase
LREQLRQTQDELNAVQIQNGQLRTRLAIITAPPASTLAAPTRPSGPDNPVASAPAAAASAPAATPTAAPNTDATDANTPAANPRTYVVAAGDTLSKIARQFYGTSLRWAEIYEANRAQLPNERALAVGMKLVIP